MTVIKTNIRRKIIKLAAGTGAAAAFSAAVIAAFTVFPGALAYKNEKGTETALFTEQKIVNGDDLVLYIAEKPTITEEKNAITDDVPEEKDIEDITEADDEQLFPEKYMFTVNRENASEDLTNFSQHSGKIVSETFGKMNGAQMIDLRGGGQLRNCTDIPNETAAAESEKPSGISVELYSEQPQVLVVHTHTTESYEPYEKEWFDSSYTSRSADPKNGVVAVGDAICHELAASGISVIHDCTVHDSVYTGAYTRSLATTVSILDRYPSVKIVLDIHRDAIEYEDGTRVSAVTGIDGKKAAQIMIICAADDGNYDVPFFMDNLHFACELQQQTESMFPTLTRPILFQYCQYNQQVSKGALLIEVGSHGNSIDQAVYSGELIGKSLAVLLKKDAVYQTEAVPVISEMPLYFLDRLM